MCYEERKSRDIVGSGGSRPRVRTYSEPYRKQIKFFGHIFFLTCPAGAKNTCNECRLMVKIGIFLPLNRFFFPFFFFCLKIDPKTVFDPPLKGSRGGGGDTWPVSSTLSDVYTHYQTPRRYVVCYISIHCTRCIFLVYYSPLRGKFVFFVTPGYEQSDYVIFNNEKYYRQGPHCGE